MKQSCRYTLRRHAAIGAAVAIVTASSAFGIGATAATAATAVAAPAANSTIAAPVAASAASPAAAATTSSATAADPADSTPETAAPADTTGAGTDTAAPDADPAATTPITWAEPSSEAAPIVLTATAGQPFSHTFVAQGGDGPLTYRFEPRQQDTGWQWDEQTGVLSGTPTSALSSSVLFEVTATDQHRSAVQYAQVEVQPAAAAGVALTIAPQDDRFVWSVYLDGVVHQSTPGVGDDTVVPAITVRDGETLSFAGLAVDEYGNPTTPGDDYPRSTGTSTDAADSIVWDDQWKANRVTFSGAGSRTVTISEGGVSTSVPVVVSAAAEDAQVAGFAIGVLPDDGSDDRYGIVDGVVTRYAEDGTAEQVDAIPARQGDRVQVRAIALDTEGNPVGDHSDLTFTSSVASDRIAYDPDEAATWITFDHASPHVVTVAYQGVSATIPFEVTPVTAPAASTTPTVGSSTPTASGHLAFTGADESGPLAWALGLLAAGAGLLVHRMRRRRA
ncbi:putative Ig domain-containing protein [Curtobacterium sp. ER1/6]|uniref:putative Ig domain-containing protein n=1 Tax=Curtobacterium sp. ER1/6 TaxID=1891920 RepID=UPI00084FB052|nr:putative Ig domain-containing protein [Curtobacterium sp. ER1/6]